MITIAGDWVSSTMVHSGQVGSTGHVAQGVGSEEVSVTGSPLGSFPVAVAKL